MNITPATDTPWRSDAIPDWTRAAPGARTPSGAPAVFRSSCHAWIALRLVYLAEVAQLAATEVQLKEARYRWAWERFVRHGGDMQRLSSLIGDDLHAAAMIWNAIDQAEVDEAFSTVICEREPWPKINLASMALKHFELHSDPSDTEMIRDRKLADRDNEAAWQATPLGMCRACGTPTVSQRLYERLRRKLAAHPDLFDLSPTYRQTNGSEAPLWSNRIVIAAKGVADHVVPWCDGGRTTPDNLANVCSGCNYSRNNTSLDTIRVATYR